jgi:hypothetical protein
MPAEFDFSVFTSSELFQNLVVIDEFVTGVVITFNFGGVSPVRSTSQSNLNPSLIPRNPWKSERENTHSFGG